MPGTGASPAHAYPFGDAYAAYRLPFAGVNGFVTPRAAGVVAEGEPGDGSNPPAGGDPPKPPAPSPTPPTPPATGEPQVDADGMASDAGREALRKERDRASRAEKALAELQATHATDDEKRDASLKAAAAKERDEYWAGRIRTTEVRSALRAKGLTDDKQLNLAANAPEFAALKVDEEGRVADLDRTIETFTKDYPNLFISAKPTGQPTRGAQGTPPPDRPKNLSDAITARLGAQA